MNRYVMAYNQWSEYMYDSNRKYEQVSNGI